MRAFCLDLSFARKRSCFYRLYGGRRGIRTAVTLSGKAVFNLSIFPALVEDDPNGGWFTAFRVDRMSARI
jgi:hypothetical protein